MYKIYTDLLHLGYDRYTLEDTSPSPGQPQVTCELIRTGDKYASLTVAASTGLGALRASVRAAGRNISARREKERELQRKEVA